MISKINLSKSISSILAALLILCVLTAGGITASADSIDTQSPSTPGNLTVNAVVDANYSSIDCTFSWDISTDNVGVAGYFIYEIYNPAYPSDYNEVSFTETNSYNTIFYPNRATKYFAVVAIDDAGNRSSISNIVSVDLFVFPPTPAPVDLSVSNVSATGLTLHWYGQSWNGAYKVTISDGTTSTDVYCYGYSYAFDGLTQGKTYTFTVTAYGRFDASPPSQPLVVSF
ncbi:MAG: hypothetical protein BGN88_11465 [Clostridiales bacterium 43-6]|nr:MAG: hypothetical protein BGN88_11465 [Clostridiales bacterium 43-6]